MGLPFTGLPWSKRLLGLLVAEGAAEGPLVLLLVV